MAEPTAPDLAFRVPLDVRFRDLDAMGHVNNAVFATYLEIARTRYWQALGEPRFDFILARLEIDYRAPIEWGDELAARVGVVDFGRSSFVFGYRLEKSDGTLAAAARSVQVWYDYGTKTTAPLPDEVRQRIVAFEAGLRGTGATP